MKRRATEEFYVGYRPEAPAGIAGCVRRTVIVLLGIGLLVAVIAALAQQPFARSVFEFGRHRSFEGYVSERPYPTLLVARPAAGTTALPYSRYLLSVPGKHGATAAMAGLDGRRVRLDATLIYRDDQVMLEIVPETVSAVADAGQGPQLSAESLGRFVLDGEIIDSKCYLGVMKPGNGKPHRSCAIRCIAGGIPPLFVTRDASDNPGYLLLTGADGRTLNRAVLPYVADPLRIEGEVLREGGVLILRADPGTFTRRDQHSAY